MTAVSVLVIGWTTIVYNLLWIPIIIYHCYLYWKNRDHRFIKARLPITTLLFVITMIIMLLFRTIDALTGMKYITDIFALTAVPSFVQFFPYITISVYKLC